MDNFKILKKLKNLNIDTGLIGLEYCENVDMNYFCTPKGSEVFGWLGCDGIHFCFIPSLLDIIFIVNPLPSGEHYVEPVANNLLDFLRLICSCRDASVIEFVSWMAKCDFDEFVKSNVEASLEVLQTIQKSFNIDLIEDPYEYVKTIQQNFDYDLIPFSDEYYNT